MDDVADWLAGQDDGAVSGLGALWGKSDAGGSANLLVQHLLDAVAVAELVWDQFLAPCVHDELDRITEGNGRSFLSWLCGVHDVGKTTPSFQQQDRLLGERVKAAGLTWGRLPQHPNRSWRHERASAAILRAAVHDAGWREASKEWVWPLLGGHHGRFPGLGEVNDPRPTLHGRDPAWARTQRALVDLVTTACGYDGLRLVEPHERPTRAFQLALSGFVIKVDWIASNHDYFVGIDDLASVSLQGTRKRAEHAWRALGLRGGWGRLPRVPDDPVRERFGLPPRPGQRIVVEAARAIPRPGLVIVEAPTGEGKTEAALATAEILAARFGADGIFVGMPTQATSDPMLTRVGRWANQVSPGAQVALLHGKSRFNREWRELTKRRTPKQVIAQSPVDEFGVPDAGYGHDTMAPAGIDEGDETSDDQLRAAVEWLLGSKRGLLSPIAIGTIDQLLFAATRTKHVALRFAGLVGKVVILDEVHAADVYMQQFLGEALWWLGQAGVPVVLLSATLPPSQRAFLMSEYVRGTANDPSLAASNVPEPNGYPSVTSVWWDGEVRHQTRTESSWRPARRLQVEVLDEPKDDPVSGVVELVKEATREGGCVLVLRNTVDRAQRTYVDLSARLGDDVVLLHGRLSAGDRADRTARLLDQLGAPTENAVNQRPHRLVVVATQVAEQSFDVDVDLLVTDLAPVDLLLQRAGRLHRHDRPPDQRPALLHKPRMVVTGFHRSADGPPEILQASQQIYGEQDSAHSRRGTVSDPTYYRAAAPLLRTAALVEEAAGDDGWSLPEDVPRLVAAAYAETPIGPPSWHDSETTEQAAYATLKKRRANSANPFRLATTGNRSANTLEGLHTGDARSTDEEELRAVVRDGPRSAEVILVRRHGERIVALGGYDLGINGDGIHDEYGFDAALAGTVRLPSWERLTRQVEVDQPEHRRQVAAWVNHPWTAHSHVLVLDDGKTELGDGHTISYDPELGLLVERPFDKPRVSRDDLKPEQPLGAPQPWSGVDVDARRGTG